MAVPEQELKETISPLPLPQDVQELSNDSEEDSGHASHGTKRGIRSRHSQMLVIGGTIGTGLFVGTGQALATSGPAFLFSAYLVICFLVYAIVTAITEVGAYMPVPGMSVAYYGNRIVSPSLGFALGWMYFYTWGISVAYEVTAAAVVIDYWPNTVPVAAWITIMLFVIISLNLLPVGVYGESEFWFASIKVFTIIGLLILSAVLFFGGGPSHTRLGFWYWQDPGPVKEYLVGGAGGRFCAFLFTLIYSCFSFNFSPELVIITAGEMQSPRKNLPRAALHFTWRLVIFYALGALAISVICRSDESALANGGKGVASSPWVIAIKNAGIHGLDSVINAAVITSAWSSGNSVLYMSSRSLYSLAIAGNAPPIFARCNKHGVPMYAVIASSLLSLLAYLNVGTVSGIVFNWFVSVINTAAFISWTSCCLIFFRFRRACEVQGIAKADLPYSSVVQPYAAWVAIVAFGIFGLLNGFSVFFPGHFTVSDFFAAYIGIPAFSLIYFGHRIVTRSDPWIRAPRSVDLKTGLSDVLVDGESEVATETVVAPTKYNSHRWLKSIYIMLGWD
ncbi:amino acid permease/ SLC12A domain-containing protein [Hypoxylon trugodes]|uniref:amino acid permease/ SLC12A domain-containing protein n=1 Tax=Hypoxylon trugodes TaxID=326681 RepID=UPI00219034F4|nr:amino acid permease/ SLC12A domain-containing protein [Hypoxylon trugodes]KAI1393982.1 amino acid permease/ SLC12A domain-containing protein [Hypoxylon trugodes]